MAEDGAQIHQPAKRPKPMNPRWCCGGCFVPLVMLLLVSAFWPAGCEILLMSTWHVDHMPFDSEVWKQPVDAKVESECIRGRMVRDLMVNRRLDGLTRDGVIEMLGQPEAIGSHSRRTYLEDLIHPEIAIMRADTWEYYLGFCSGFQVDPDFLVIEFGEDGQVEDYGTYQG